MLGVFFSAGNEYAVPVEVLEEVISEPPSYVPMPLAPPSLLGLFSLRGAVLPVLDLPRLLQLRVVAAAPTAAVGGSETLAPARAGKIAILRRGGARVGVRFDAIGEVLRLRASEIQETPFEIGSARPVGGVIERIDGRLILVLNFEGLIPVANLPLQPDAVDVRRATRGTGKRWLSFRLAGGRFAIDSALVRRIVRPGQAGCSPLRPESHNEEFCEHSMQDLGHSLPVVRLDRILALPTSPALPISPDQSTSPALPTSPDQSTSPDQPTSGTDPAAPVVVCTFNGHEVGFAVDKLDELIAIRAEEILPIPLLSDFRADVFHGCYRDREGVPVVALAGEALLGDGRVRKICENFARVSAQGSMVHSQSRRGHARQASILSFRLGALFGMRLLDVRQILEAPLSYIRTPAMPPSVLGTISLRGVPMPVIDPRQLFDLPPAAVSRQKILVFEDGENQDAGRFGMVVDSIESLVAESSQEMALPNVLFRKTHASLGTSFDRAIETVGPNGAKEALVLLESGEILRRLRQALGGEQAVSV